MYRQDSPAEFSIRNLKSPNMLDWEKIVKFYMRKQLSVAADKLPAISSIASFFARKTGDDYLAGFWRGSFRRFMCWSTNAPYKTTRPAHWRAPSWSFLSIDCADGIGIFYNPNTVELDYLKEFKGTNHTLSCLVVSCEVLPLSSQVPFGELKSANLQVYGRLIRVKLYKDSLATGHPWPGVKLAGRQEIRYPYVTLDCRDALRPESFKTIFGWQSYSEPLWFLYVYTRQVKQETRAEGIVLAKVSEGRYTHVGSFSINGTTPWDGEQLWDFFLEQEPQHITII